MPVAADVSTDFQKLSMEVSFKRAAGRLEGSLSVWECELSEPASLCTENKRDVVSHGGSTYQTWWQSVL